MEIVFKRIGLIGKQDSTEIQSTLITLIELLDKHHIQIIIEASCAAQLTQTLPPKIPVNIQPKDTIGQYIDLLIVIGGDGSLLNAARAIVDDHIPVIGVNKGRLGFLTDICPQSLEADLMPVLYGQFKEEQRFLLQCDIFRANKSLHHAIALNDVVLYSGDIARLIEFEVRIDKQFVYKQRSDGLITCTPTGSTAYALAGGGPIVHPGLAAIALVPMHPLTLSSRPIVIHPEAEITLFLTKQNQLKPRLSCDGQIHFNLEPEDKLIIQRYPKTLRLIHPLSYDYYHTLRGKLGWSNAR